MMPHASMKIVWLPARVFQELDLYALVSNSSTAGGEETRRSTFLHQHGEIIKILQLMHFMLVKDIVHMIGNALEPSYVEKALIARTHPKTMILKDAVNKVYSTYI